MFNYFCLNNISESGLSCFGDNFVCTDVLEEADGVLVRSKDLHGINFNERLACICRAGVGVNNIDIDYCTKRGIVVFNTPGANANAVKELVIAGMLISSRNIYEAINWLSKNASMDDISSFVENNKKQFVGSELLGKKLGIIGLGAIGTQIANTAYALGMDVYGFDPYLSINSAWNLNHNVKRVNNADDIYKKCDYISIHVPYLESTKHTVNQSAIDLMKSNAVILNFARDKLVDEKYLMNALERGKVHAYVSDFPNSITAGHERCIVIPHLGASTLESENNCARLAVYNMTEYLQHGNILHSVNFPPLNNGVCTSRSRLCLLHKNVSNMISQFTTIIGRDGFNIANMSNKSKGEHAYTMIDIDNEVNENLLSHLKNLDDVYKVRLVRQS